MKILRINPNFVDAEVISMALDILAQGGVVVHPTDTCYGMAADVFNKDAVRRLQNLKKMSTTKPISVIVNELEHIYQYVEVNRVARDLIEKYWPGPLTLVLPRKNTLPPYYNQDCDTLGLRYPDCQYSLAIAREFGRFVTTTSANIGGNPSSYSLYEILKQFEECDLKPDLVLDAGELPRRSVSTIVEIVNDEVKILRSGDLKIDLKIGEHLKNSANA